MPNAAQIESELRVEKLDITTLEFAEYNPRAMTPEARTGLNESLDALGLLELPIVNESHDPPRIIGGHQRVRDLLDKGFTHADCVVTRMDDVAEMAANVALNNHATQGTFDPVLSLPNLERVAKRLPTPNFTRFEEMGEKLREQARRVQATSNPKASDAITEKQATPDSEAGTIYKLGEHRLYCGDFHEGVPALLKRKKAAATITDPPYNLAYTSGKWFRNDKLREEISGDEQDAEAWATFTREFCAAILKATKGAVYMFCAAKEIPTVQHAFEESGGDVHRWIVCAKNAHTLSPGDYHPQYEMLLWGAKQGAEISYYGKTKTNVIQTKRPAKSALHPTQKTTALIRELVEDATDVGDLVLDPFAGSGTTLCVAEEIERVCYSVEIDPEHCDTIRRRWAEQVHGKDAEWKTLTPEA
jgi:DNA modification methylase